MDSKEYAAKMAQILSVYESVTAGIPADDMAYFVGCIPEEYGEHDRISYIIAFCTGYKRAVNKCGKALGMIKD